MKNIARSYVYWPDINEHIDNLVCVSRKCVAASKRLQKSELYSWPSPSKLWSRIHIDFAGPFQGTCFLVCVEAYTKWSKILSINQITSQETIVKLWHLFTSSGVLDIL